VSVVVFLLSIIYGKRYTVVDVKLQQPSLITFLQRKNYGGRMSRTFDELLEYLAEQIDEVTLLEVLEITSYDIVERFEDKIKYKEWKFNDETE
jgi:hypothetical protein